LLFKFGLEHAFRKFQVNQDGMKLNWAHQLLVNAKKFIMLGGNVRTTKKTTELLLIPIRET